MKIKIKTNDCKLNLRFPTCLIVIAGRITVSIIVISMKDKITFTQQQKRAMIKMLKVCRKQFKGLKLVDVKTATGEIIEITI